MKGQNEKRLLSIHATTRGFAFCLFDSPSLLYDWGIVHVGRHDKNKESLARIERLITRYDPHAIVFEDVTETGSKRVARVRALYRDIERLADRASLDVYSYPWQVVNQVFGNTKTRHDLAVQIAEMLPNIKRRLPPKRKIWLPQDPRQALFDAAAQALAHYAVNG